MRDRKVLSKFISYLVVMAMLITTMTGLEKAVKVQAMDVSSNNQYLVPVLESDGITPQREADGSVRFVGVSLEGATALTATTSAISGVYYVEGNITAESRIRVENDAILVLKNGSELTAKGITVPEGKTLIISAQTTDVDATGTDAMGKIWDTSGISDGSACIGGEAGQNSGRICIYGGNISVSVLENGAGIGGGAGTNSTNMSVTGDICIYGGWVKPLSENGAAIGSGYLGRVANIYIFGGTVEAEAEDDGAGIGSGGSGYVEKIEISGGTVEGWTLNGYRTGAGIGSGKSGYVDKIEISGGYVYGCSPLYGAGIGSGRYGTVKTIKITGGTIVGENTLLTDYGGAGIGGGNAGSIEEILISGGTVTAYGGNNASCIGGGAKEDSDSDTYHRICEKIEITGGNITAKSFSRENCCGIGNGNGVTGNNEGTEIIIKGSTTIVSVRGSNAPAIRVSTGSSSATSLDTLEIGGDVTSDRLNTNGSDLYPAETPDNPRPRRIIISESSDLNFTVGTATTQNAGRLSFSGFASIPSFECEIVKNDVVVTDAGISASITAGEISVTTSADTPVGNYKVKVKTTNVATNSADYVIADVCNVVVAEPQSNIPYYYPVFVPAEEPEAIVTPAPEEPKEEEKKDVEKKTVEQVPEKLAKKITDKLSDAFGSKKIEATYSSPAEAQTATRKGKTYYDENGDPVQNAFIKLKSGEIRYTNEDGKYVKKTFVAVIDPETNKIDTYYVGKSSYVIKDKTFVKHGEKLKADSEGKIEGKSYKIKSNGKIKLDTDKKN